MFQRNKKSPFRIAIDASDICADMYKGGIYHYVVNLCSNLRDLDNDNEYIIFFNYFTKRHETVCREVMRILEGRKMKVKLSRLPRTLLRKLQPPMNVFIGNVDVLHGPFDYVPPMLGCKKIVTIHDLRSYDFASILEESLRDIKDYPQYSENFKGWIEWMSGMRERVAMAVRAADRIIAVSNFSKNSLVKHTSANPEKVDVIYNGISSSFRQMKGNDTILSIRGKLGIKNKYLLFVGHLDPLKNILRMIEAYRSLLDSVKSHDALDFVIVTPTLQNNWFCGIIEEKISKMSLSGHIHIMHNVSGEALPSIYNGATALVLPSLYEGFGLPVIEAISCGTPVVASNTCSLPEIAGNAALFVDPVSTDSIANGIYKLLSDDRLRNELIMKGLARAKLFTWQNTAKETLKVYRKLLEH